MITRQQEEAINKWCDRALVLVNNQAKIALKKEDPERGTCYCIGGVFLDTINLEEHGYAWVNGDVLAATYIVKNVSAKSWYGMGPVVPADVFQKVTGLKREFMTALMVRNDRDGTGFVELVRVIRLAMKDESTHVLA